MRSVRLVALAAALIAGPLQSQAPTHPRVLTLAEIQSTAGADMLAVVRAARPDWLGRARAAYLDGTDLGAVQALAEVSVRGVRYARLVPRSQTAPGVRRAETALVVQVITSEAPADQTSLADIRAFTTPRWGVGPQLSVSGGIPKPLGDHSVLQESYKGGWTGSASLSYPIAPGMSLRGQLSADHLPARETGNREGAVDIRAIELGLKGVWGSSSIAHPYAVLGAGYYQLSAPDDEDSGGLGFNLALGVEVNIAAPVTGFLEVAQSMSRDAEDVAFGVRRVRVGAAVEFQRSRFGRQR